MITQTEKVKFDKWSTDYDVAINNPPKDGDILTALSGEVRLVVELVEGAPPFIYGRAYVPEIIGERVGWFLQGEDTSNFHGWKCILLPRARTELIKKFGLKDEAMHVKSLRVIRPSKSGQSLLCEVHKYLEEPVEAVVEAVVKEEVQEIAELNE